MTFLILIAILGASIGSFLGVIIDNNYKLPKIKQRSKCKICKEKLTPLLMIPILSFIFLKGKCKYCKAKIPTKLLIIELFSLIGFVIIFTSSYQIVTQIILSLIFCTNLIISIHDKEVLAVKNSDITLNTVLCLILGLNLYGNINILSAIIGFLLFYIVYILSQKKGVGIGDAYLLFGYGLALDIETTILCFFLAFWIASLYLLIQILLFGIKNIQKAIPMAPFLSLSFFICLKYGKFLIQLII